MIQPVASSTSSTCSPCAFLSSSESRVLSTSVLFHCSVENIQKKHAVSCFIMYLEKFNNFFAKHCWLVVLTILKSISQWEGLSHILWKIKHVWNHQPDWHCTSVQLVSWSPLGEVSTWLLGLQAAGTQLAILQPGPVPGRCWYSQAFPMAHP